MKALLHTLLVGCVVLLCTGASIAQKSLLKQANKLYAADKYAEALTLYDKYAKLRKDKSALYRRAISAYKTGRYYEAVDDFSQAYKLGQKNPLAFLYTAESYMALSNYDDAATFFKNYVRRGKDKTLLKQAKDNIRRCAYAKKLLYRDQLAYAENLGTSVNTKYNEIKPLISPNNVGKFYFSSDRDISTGGLRTKSGERDDLYGHYKYDLYAVELSNGNWTSVYPFNSLQNTPQHEVLEGFSKEGSVMFYRKSNFLDKAEIYVDTFSNDLEKRMFPTQITEPINGYLGDKDLFIFNDSTYLFASNHLDGYGGYDLYVVTQVNGVWQKPQNLGPQVNSKYNDTAPFLTAGGGRLLFSSDRLETLGKADLFVTQYDKEQGKWLIPANLGTPINSAGDESSIQLSKDGNQALVSSDRVGGNGGYDLYLMYLREQVTDQLRYTEALPFIRYGDAIPEEIVVDDKANDQPFIEQKPVKTIDFVSNDLYYLTEQDILSPTNLVILKNIIELDKLVPDLEYRLSAHSTKEQSNATTLFFSTKRAEKVKKYLVEKGVDADRIRVEGFGSSAHLVNPSLGNAARFNNRIELHIPNAKEKMVNLNRKQGVITENMKLQSYRDFDSKQKGLAYMVKLTETNQLFRSPILEKSNQGLVVQSEDKYIYYVGHYATYQKARLAKLNLQQQGELNAKVVVFINGIEISEDQLEYYATQYKDLADYLRYK